MIENRVKPDLRSAMTELIRQVRAAIPFDLSPDELCDGACRGCSQKLIEFLDQQLVEWEQRIEAGETPTFGELHELAKRSKKIARVLGGNGLIIGGK